MDALILSCGTGGGHDSAGRAIMEELQKRGHNAVMLNPYTLRSNRLAKKIDNAYILTVQRAPKVFGAIYVAGDLVRKLPFRSPVYHINRGMVQVMREYLGSHHFDVIIMPHLFPAEIVTNMKLRGIPIPKTIYIDTDYTCIPFTEETECDAYIAPVPEVADEFVTKGIPEEKVFPFGIPTHSSFVRTETQADIKKRLGLAPDMKYILISGGSIGAGKVEKAIDVLQSLITGTADTQLIVICGSNQELFERLKKRYGSKLLLIGHTHSMSDYMKASDLYITKPGGLSSTEAAVCGIPMLHISPISGCEVRNVRYFTEHGMSLSCKVSESAILDAVESFHNDESRAAMVENQRKTIPQDSASKICDLAEELCASQLRITSA